MKNIFYIPFLILIALTCTRMAENLEEDSHNSSLVELRKPASLKIDKQEDCVDLFNKV